MELKLELKLTRGVDDFTSYFQIAKDPLFLSRETGDMFILTAHLKDYKRENIKIDINEDGTLITVSGERQVKECTVSVGWKVYKEDTETKAFNNVFRIPYGVILDKIKANYNDDDFTLKITMPKKVKGISRGTTNIEEIKEKHELDYKEGSSSDMQIVDDIANSKSTRTHDQENDENTKMTSDRHVMEAGDKKRSTNEEKQEDDSKNNGGKADDIQETSHEHIQDVNTWTHDQENDENAKMTPETHVMEVGDKKRTTNEEKQEDDHSKNNGGKVDDIQKTSHEHIQDVNTETHDQENDENAKMTSETHVMEAGDKKRSTNGEKQEDDSKNYGGKVDDIQETSHEHIQDANMHENDIRGEEGNEGPFGVEPRKVENDHEINNRKSFFSSWEMCAPIVAGSTLLVSFVVFVLRIIRSNNRTGKKGDC